MTRFYPREFIGSDFQPLEPDDNHIVYVGKHGKAYEDGSSVAPFKTWKAAIAYVQSEGPSQISPWAIEGAPGIYVEDNSSNPLILPAWTVLRGSGRLVTVISPSDNDEDLISTPEDMDFVGSLRNLTLAASGSNETALNADPKTTGAIRDQQLFVSDVNIRGFDKGIKVEEEGTLVYGTHIMIQECAKGIHVDNAKYCSIGTCVYSTVSADYALKSEGSSGQVKVFDCDIDGNFDEGCYADDGGEIHMQGLTIDDCDDGIRTRDHGEIKIHGGKIHDAQRSVFAEGPDNFISIIGADLDASTIEKSVTSIVDITGTHPTRQQCAVNANIIEGHVFNDGHIEREDDFDNVFVDTFSDMSKIDANTNIQVLNGRVTLDSTQTLVQYESCDAIGPWLWQYSTEGNFSIDTVVQKEGTGCFKLSDTTVGGSYVGQFRNYIRKYINPNEDWSAYGEFGIWVRSTVAGSKVRMRIYNQSPFASVFAEYTIQAANTWEWFAIDISQMDHSAIYYVYIWMERRAVPYDLFIDDMNRGTTPIYDASGSFENVTIQPHADDSHHDIYEMLLLNEFEEIPDTTVTFDLSLDGGTHWLTGLGYHHFENWLQTVSGGYLETADASVAWDNKRNLKMRFNLATTDTSVTPEINGLSAIWRVNKA